MELRTTFRTTEVLSCGAAASDHGAAAGARAALRGRSRARGAGRDPGRAALRRIPLNLQVALELRCWEKLSSAEIAEVLDIPASIVRNHLSRARTLLEEALAERAAAPDVVESTISDLDAWAEQLRGVVYGNKASQ